MSTLYRRGGDEGVFYVGVPTSSGTWVKRTTGTRLAVRAKPMGAMIDQLGIGRDRDWELLDPVAEGRMSVAQLHDAWSKGSHALEALRASLRDSDAQEAIPGWLEWLRDRVAPDTVEHYTTHVRSFIPRGKPFPVSRLNPPAITRWLAALPGTPGTKKKYRAALSSFAKYLVLMRKLSKNPVLEVDPPKATPPRMRHLTHAQVIALVEAQREPFRTISALMHATGMEISAVLRATCADLDTETWMIRAHGTKTSSRDRQAYIKKWARPYLLAHIAGMAPGAQLFPGISRRTPRDSHKAACDTLGISDYTLRDSRHTFAVQAAKGSIPAEFIAAQFGHADTQMVNKVYMRFLPTRAEMARVFERSDTLAAEGEG